MIATCNILLYCVLHGFSGVPADTYPLVDHFLLGQFIAGRDTHEAKHVDQIQIERRDSTFSSGLCCFGVADEVFSGGLKAEVNKMPLTIASSIEPLANKSKDAGNASTSGAPSKSGGEKGNGISFQLILQSLGWGAIGGLLVCWPMVLFICVRLWVEKPWR